MFLTSPFAMNSPQPRILGLRPRIPCDFVALTSGVFPFVSSGGQLVAACVIKTQIFRDRRRDSRLALLARDLVLDTMLIRCDMRPSTLAGAEITRAHTAPSCSNP